MRCESELVRRLKLRVLGLLLSLFSSAAMVLSMGCQSTPIGHSPNGYSQATASSTGQSTAESDKAPEAEPAEIELASSKPDSRTALTPERKATPDTRTSDQPVGEQEALTGVLDKLQEIGAIDPAAQQHLMTKLRAADPKFWSSMVDQFQSTLAFRQQLMARDSQHPGIQMKQTHDQQRRATLGQKERSMPDNTTVVSSDQVPVALTPTSPHASQVVLLDPPAVNSTQPSSAQGELPERGTENMRVVEEGTQTVVGNPTVRAVSYQSNEDILRDGLSLHNQRNSDQPKRAEATEVWEQTIALMEELVTEVPDSTDDIHQQMRLRMLYLIAGRQEESLRPISGATPAQQDYWSQQLFALATFLDNHALPDNKRRATAALLHLDEARDTLAQLATLDVRNLIFVESVDGYGVYKPVKETKFDPEQQVILYAEVENFHCESIEKGYRISLSTSYQVMDDSGRRVDGAEFPEVVDQCQSHRRDFHIQYGIPLPKRIYPGNYHLQLIVTDNQTGKIGQATLPFQIADEH
jgi:hypothetical protein